MRTRICTRGAVYASLVPRPFCGGGKGLPCKKWPGYEARYTRVINCEPMNPKCEGDYRCKQSSPVPKRRAQEERSVSADNSTYDSMGQKTLFLVALSPKDNC